MGDVNLEIKLSNLTDRVDEIVIGDTYIESVSPDFNVVNKQLNLSDDFKDDQEQIHGDINQISTKLSDLEDWNHGKNLFDKENVVVGYYKSDGTTAYSSGWRRRDIEIESGQPYSITSLGKDSGSVYCVWLDSNRNFISIACDRYSDSPQENLVAPQNAKYLGVSVDDATGELDVFQVEKGSSATSYEPFAKSNVAITNELSNKANTIQQRNIALTTDSNGNVLNFPSDINPRYVTNTICQYTSGKLFYLYFYNVSSGAVQVRALKEVSSAVTPAQSETFNASIFYIPQ